MLQHQIERILRATQLEKLVLATSNLVDDDAVASIGERCGIDVYRGSLDDVLNRFYLAAAPYAPSHAVRLTGDCPLADPEIIDGAIRFALDGGYDYVSNGLDPTFPDGLDVEVITFATLEAAWREATSRIDREHVTPFIYSQPDRFRLGSFKNATDLSWLRWTVDESADFEMVDTVFRLLYPEDPNFGTKRILELLAANPEIATLNAGIERNEGYRLALEKYQESLK